MPNFRRVAPSIHVADLDRAVAFYRDALGFRLECVDEPPVRAVVTQGDAVLHLDRSSDRAGTSRTHLLTDDLDGVHDRLRQAGATVLQPPTVQPWGLRELVVADPDGNVFELAQPVG